MYDDVFHNEVGFPVPPEHIPSEADLERYAKGDSSVVDTLISGLMQFTINVVDRYSKEDNGAAPFKEDLISEGLLELVEVVNNKLGSRFTAGKFLGYLKRSIIGRLNDWRRENVPTLTIAKSTQYDAEQDGIVLLGHKVELKDYHLTTSESAVFGSIWFDDFMDAQTALDQEIVRLKIEGLSNRAIAGKVGLESRHVETHLERLYREYIGEEE